MLFDNGKNPGGYSIESYEPTDVRPEENKKANEFIKSAFENRIINQPKFDYNITTLSNTAQNYYSNNNNISYVSRNPQNILPFYNTINSSSNSFVINKLNKSSNYQTVNNLKLINPIVPQYSNMTKYVYPKRTVINFANANNFNIPKMNYQNINIPQSIQPIHKRSKTIETFIPAVRQTQLINKYNFNNNPIPMPLAKPQKLIFTKYASVTKNILPIYPTITYRRINIY